MASPEDKTPQPRSPAPNHDPVFAWPTPNEEDLLFFVEKNGDLPKNQSFTYGELYKGSNANKYPTHQLVFVSPQTTEKWSQWYYASARILEDEYNWEFTDADIGGTKFAGVKRSYVTLRSAFSAATPAQGSTMANVPSGQFSGTYVLAGRQQVRSNDPKIDNLFVIDERIYVKRATMADINTDRTLGIGVQELTTLYYRGEYLAAPISLTVEAFFAAPTNANWGLMSDGVMREGRQLTDNWFAIIETSSRDAALLAYKRVLPTTTNIPDMPDVLTGIDVVWNTGSSVGQFDSDWNGQSSSIPDSQTHLSLGGSEAAQADASASVQADLAINIRSPSGRGIPSTALFFYMKLTNGTLDEADFLARITAIMGDTVTRWPQFTPESHSIITKGMKVSVSAQAKGAASFTATGDTGTGDGHASWDKNQGFGNSFDVSTINGVTRIPPTIHGAITILDTTNSADATAECDVGWVGTGTGGSIAGIALDFPDVTAASSATATAEGSVSPTSLSATTPSEIPSSGLYMVEPRIQSFEGDWVQCYAEVFDASLIA